MRCAERAGGILDTCSDFSLIKHDIPEQSHSISGNGDLDVFTCASSSVPFRLLFESWLCDECFWGEHLCFWRPEKRSVTSVWVRWPPSAAVTWCFSSTVGHKDSPSTPANFLPYLWPSFSSKTPRCTPGPRKVVISSWELREKESSHCSFFVISFLLEAIRGRQTHERVSVDHTVRCAARRQRLSTVSSLTR